jgi:hypothetical protein
MGQTTEHQINPCSLGCKERISAKIWELLRRNVALGVGTRTVDNLMTPGLPHVALPRSVGRKQIGGVAQSNGKHNALPPAA